MNKCEHGEKINVFCATDNCQYKEAAGCDLCIKKYHSHLSHCLYLNEEEVNALMRKFTVDNTIKPKCRLLQEAIYAYFSQLKNQLTNSLDTTCKNVINQIGYPYLFATNTLSTYKRLKNKEYKKITQKEFKHFYEIVNKIEEKELMKEENKIYQVQIKNTSQILNQLENIIKNYQNAVKIYHSSFSHEAIGFQKISEIMRSISSQSSVKSLKKGVDIKEKEKQQVQYKYNKDVPRINIINTPINNTDFPINSKFESKLNEPKNKMQKEKSERTDRGDEIDHHTLTPTTLQPPKVQRTRDVSLDKKITTKIYSNQQEKSKDAQKVELRLHNQKIENLKHELNSKQLEINEKKKILLDIMKPNEKTEKPFERLQSITGVSIIKQKYSDSQATQKRQHLKTQDKSINESKSSKSSEDLAAFQQQNSKMIQNTKNYAFAKLPILEDVSSKKDEKQQIKKKLIIIPTDHHTTISKDKNKEIDSPLYKKKQTEFNHQEKAKDQKKQKYQILTKKVEVQNKAKDTLQLKENEQKSLALLLKSLTLKAEDAIVYLQSSLKYADNNLSAAEYLSYLYLELNRPKDCLTLCNKILDRLQLSNEPEIISININNNKAAALNILGRYSEAILIIQRCLKNKQKDTLFKNLGDSYFSIGIYEKAIYNYEKSLKLNPNNDQCHYNLAVCLYIQQNYTNSKLSINRALEIQPKQDIYIQLSSKIDDKIASI